MEQVLVNGAVLSANYALIALGITLIFSIMSILNFAHGQMFMIGAFMVYYVYGVWKLPYALGLVAAALVVGLIGVLFQVFFFRRVQKIASREENSMLLAVGTALLLENLALFAFGEKQRGVPPVVGGVTCNRCGRVNKPGARFCAGCGAPLGAPPVARLLITSPRGSWEQKLDRMPMRIGRRDPRQNHYPELDLAEHDRGIASRNHAVINRDGDYYTITDIGSTNGTMLNGTPIPQRAPARLRAGDRIKIGEVEMEFRGS